MNEKSTPKLTTAAIAYGLKQTCLFAIDYQFLENSFFQCQTSSALILSVSKY